MRRYKPDLARSQYLRAIAILLEALRIPGNRSNKAKLAEALKLLGARIPEGK